jgi:hypothetical protein
MASVIDVINVSCYQEHVELEKRYRELTDLLVCNKHIKFFLLSLTFNK